jgi:hypothetical protein
LEVLEVLEAPEVLRRVFFEVPKLWLFDQIS